MEEVHDDGMRRAAVLGSPIAHSLSPVLHRAAYRRLGLQDRWAYEAHEVDEAALPGFLAALGPQWAGLSLTMPLKRAVIPLLDVIAPAAAAVDAVNTVVLRPDGTCCGDNTDVPGLVAALAERGVTSAASAAVLGGGATTASTVAALGSLVTGPVEIYVRTPERLAQLAPVADAFGVELVGRPWTEAAKAAFEHPLVVNTTPVGAADALAEAVPARPGVLFDVLYHPWPTALARAWREGGGAVLGGLDLLVNQAVLQVELMTGADSARREELVTVMRAAGQAALDER